MAEVGKRKSKGPRISFNAKVSSGNSAKNCWQRYDLRSHDGNPAATPIKKPVASNTPGQPTKNVGRKSSLKPGGNNTRPYHRNHDPNISLRSAEQRLRLSHSTDWGDMSLREDHEQEDYEKYCAKLRRRVEEGRLGRFPEIVSDLTQLIKKQAHIDKGKTSDEYKQYLLALPKECREKHNPRTPNKFIVVSRRKWDAQIRRWRKHLHMWNDPNALTALNDSNVTEASEESKWTDVSDLEDIAITKHRSNIPCLNEDSTTLKEMPRVSSPHATTGPLVERNANVVPDAVHSGLTNDIKRKLSTVGDSTSHGFCEKKPRTADYQP